MPLWKSEVGFKGIGVSVESLGFRALGFRVKGLGDRAEFRVGGAGN